MAQQGWLQLGGIEAQLPPASNHSGPAFGKIWGQQKGGDLNAAKGNLSIYIYIYIYVSIYIYMFICLIQRKKKLNITLGILETWSLYI